MADDLADLNALTSRILSAAIKLHRVLGPGLPESVYTACLAHELREARFRVLSERRLPVKYEDVRIRCGFRLDVVVNETVIVEVKSVRVLAPIHEAQLLTYLKLTGCPAGPLLNFNVPADEAGHQAPAEPEAGARVSGVTTWRCVTRD